jgi:outer membrane immunogenic protein
MNAGIRRAITFGVATLAIAGTSLTAVAADLGRPITKAPPVAIPPAFSWTGFYIGAHVGGSWSDQDVEYLVTDPTGGLPFTGRNFVFCGAPTGVAIPVVAANLFALDSTCNDDNTSFLAGGQIGYNWQSGAWVFGIEADGSWRELEQTLFGVFGNNPTLGAPFGSVATDTVYMRSQQNALGTVRGRLGWAPGAWLLYVTGGLAVGEVEHTVVEVLAPGTTCVSLVAGNCRAASVSDTKVGWTVGAGIEFALGTNWSVGAEYLYVDLGTTTVAFAPTGGFFTNSSATTFDDTSHVARVKLNYRFGGIGGF